MNHIDGRMISYAQCAEDVLIARFFSSKLSGTYVDVGANHPINDSVTMNLYEAGWHGINIEPEPNFFKQLEVLRSRDINLKIGLSSADGEGQYFQVDSNLDLSTFDKNRADVLRSEGHLISVRRVPIRTLRSVLQEHQIGKVIDLLKIDVEGYELEVLRGIDFGLVRFNLMVIEVGGSQDKIRHFLSGFGYEERYFDGLNAWFTPKGESSEASFHPPSPVLDWFHPYIYLKQIEEQHEIILKLLDKHR